jgi:hypothetical protein
MYYWCQVNFTQPCVHERNFEKAFLSSPLQWVNKRIPFQNSNFHFDIQCYEMIFFNNMAVQMNIICSLINIHSLLLLLFNLRLMDIPSHPAMWRCIRLAACIKSVFHNHRMCNIYTDFRSPVSLPITSVPNSDVPKAIRHLRPSKSVGIYGILVFNIKGCSDITHIIIYFLWLSSPSQAMASSYHDVTWSNTTTCHIR